MAREIKFRAWDKVLKTMWTWDWVKNVDSPFSSGEHGTCLLDDEQFALMQYTGLKDKNRTEIYEGDVVKDLLTAAIWEVRFGFCKRRAYHGWYVHGLNIDSEGELNVDNDSERSLLEIVGNIYENPELIK